MAGETVDGPQTPTSLPPIQENKEKNPFILCIKWQENVTFAILNGIAFNNGHYMRFFSSPRSHILNVAF